MKSGRKKKRENAWLVRKFTGSLEPGNEHSGISIEMEGKTNQKANLTL